MLKITVEGPAGSGKTALTILIGEALSEYKIPNTIEDVDGDLRGKMQNFQPLIDALGRKLRGKGEQVIITQAQAPRPGQKQADNEPREDTEMIPVTDTPLETPGMKALRSYHKKLCEINSNFKTKETCGMVLQMFATYEKAMRGGPLPQLHED